MLGTEFCEKTGSLLFKSSDGDGKITSWQMGVQLYTWCGEWFPQHDPDLQLITPRDDYTEDLRGFLADIPPDVLAVAGRYEYQQMAILRMLRLLPGAMEFAGDNPVLFWLLAGELNLTGEMDRPPDEYRGLFSMKRHHLLKFIGLPARKNVVRLITRMQIDRYSRDIYKAVHAITTDPETMKWLAHCRILQDPQILAAGKAAGLLRFPALRDELNQEDNSLACLHDAFRIVRDTLRVGEELEIVERERHVRMCRNLFEVASLHGRWVERLNEILHTERMKEKVNCIFPEPPVPEIDGIVAIRNGRQLADLGKRMRNCVFSYVDLVVNGNAYIYETKPPLEECTVEIVLLAGPDPELGEVSTYDDNRPKKETIAFLKSWLRYGKDDDPAAMAVEWRKCAGGQG